MDTSILRENDDTKYESITPTILSDGNGGFVPCPELLTEEELIIFLRIPEVSKSTDYHNVIENLKRMHDLPRIHICGKPLYPREAIKEWIKEKTTKRK
ncbi:MAG: hypothetical protein MUP16_01420 [Sedimentisphaerales bacterium]|nr:hypothetical protein [Sedimentisphaerales bacterium]